MPIKLVPFLLLSVFFFFNNELRAAEVSGHYTDYFTLVSHEDFLEMTNQQKQIYVSGLQSILIEVNNYENNQEAASPLGQKTFSNLVELFFPLLALAEDKSSDKPCVFAGNILTKMANGFCKHPEKGTCADGLVQCNPLIFGENVCASPNVRATLTCLNSSRSTTDIIKYIDQHKSEWTSFSTHLKSFCDTGEQGGPCRIIQHRIVELNRTTGQESKIIAKVDSVPVAPSRSEKSDTSVTSNGGHLNVKGACQTDQLFATVPAHCTDSEGNTHRKDHAILELTQAYKIFCVDRAITKEAEATIETALATTKACLDKEYSLAKNEVLKSVAKSNAKRFLDLESNFRSCSKLLNNNKLVVENPIGTLQINKGADPIFTPLDKFKNNKLPDSGPLDPNYLSYFYHYNKLDLCQVKVLPASNPSTPANPSTPNNQRGISSVD